MGDEVNNFGLYCKQSIEMSKGDSMILDIIYSYSESETKDKVRDYEEYLGLS